jgi:hypothetical protein
MIGPAWWISLFIAVAVFSWLGFVGRANFVGWMWELVAWVCSRPLVARRLIAYAQRTPYWHLAGYMDRFWLFNSWESKRHVPWLPCIRVHHILREDYGRHPHDHPWPWRTIILRGWYWEHRLRSGPLGLFSVHFRPPGSTASMPLGEFHRISRVSPGGVWTMFITWGKPQPWGFYVDGKKIDRREYLDKKQ